MTESEWLTSESPVAMLHHLGVGGDTRKPLLYAAALLDGRPELLTPELEIWQRAVWDVLAGRRSARALDYIQTATEYEASHLIDVGPPGTRAHYAGIADAVFCVWTTAAEEYEHIPPIPTEELGPVRRANAALVRDIFGNPFRPVAFEPEWRTDTAVAIARGMYESRDFGAMPILADALQDAGCDNDDVLDHCRRAGPHVRGCWVVDLVLGLE